ncbi:MAG: hypothetical protein ACFFCX_16210 [Candidatus Sifarchaeia archaeon]
MHSNGRLEDLTLLPKLNQLGVELCIASRNDRYNLETQLDQLEIQKYFRYVMADFRPKSIQLKHLLWLYKKEECHFKKILFVDDYLPNIERVRKDIPNIQCLQFGYDIHSLSELIQLV